MDKWTRYHANCSSTLKTKIFSLFHRNHEKMEKSIVSSMFVWLREPIWLNCVL